MGGWEEYRVHLRLLDNTEYTAMTAISGQKRLADKTTIHMQLHSVRGGRGLENMHTRGGL